MSTCKSCGVSVPEGQKFCSMCYGDPNYGNDGYYQDYLDREYQKWINKQIEENMPDAEQ